VTKAKNIATAVFLAFVFFREELILAAKAQSSENSLSENFVSFVPSWRTQYLR